MRPADDPSWSHYTETILELFDDASIVLDLRLPILAEQRQRIEASPVGTRFAVVTAYNPHGVPSDPEANRDRDRRLVERLDGLGMPWVRATGRSLDGQHREPGVAAPLSVDDARALAIEFRQSAFFWYDEGVVWLMGALVDAPPTRLGT